MFTEAKLFGLNGIIMHSRSPCATPNVRLRAQDWIRADGSQRQTTGTACRSAPPRSATAEHHRSRTATQGRTAGGYPSKFSTKHITCDFFCYCCLIVHCDAQKMITFCYCARRAHYGFPQATRAKTCINFS